MWFVLRVASFVLAVVMTATGADSRNLSDFTVKDGKGDDVPLSNYKDIPAVLVVNVASQCGYTDTNYRELQALRAKHDEDALAILAFPCNQFGRQEPGTYGEILSFVGEQFGVTFPVMGKIDVNGETADPLFKWLKTAAGDAFEIPWNFSKFLVVCGGKEVKRYSHEVGPMQIEADIINAAKECSVPTEEL